MILLQNAVILALNLMALKLLHGVITAQKAHNMMTANINIFKDFDLLFRKISCIRYTKALTGCLLCWRKRLIEKEGDS